MTSATADSDTGSKSIVREIDRPALVFITVAAVVIGGFGVSRGPVVGLGAVAGMAVLLAFIRKPVIAGYAVAALVPITSGLARGVPVPGLRVSEALVLVAAIAVLGFASRAESPKFEAVDWLLLAYAVGSIALPLAQVAIHDRSVELGEFGSLLLPLQFFLIYRIVRTALRGPVEQIIGLRLLLGSSVAVCLLAVLQQLNIGPSRSLAIRLTESEALQGYAYEFFARATGPFQHWHPLAGYLTVLILLNIALLLDKNQQVAPRKVLIALTLLCSAALMLSVTFTSMFAVLLGALLLGAWSGRGRETVVWCALGAVASIALFRPFLESRFQSQFAEGRIIPETIETRIRVWTQDYFPAMDGSWAGGYGVGLPPEITWTHTESAFVSILLRGGIPLLALFIAAMVVLTIKTLVNRNDSVIAGAAAVLVVSWIMNLLYPYATSSGMSQPLWVLVAIAVSMSSRAPRPVEQKEVEV